MLNKKVMILIIFFISLLAISVVSAAENSTTDVTTAAEDTTEDVVDVEEIADDLISNEENTDSIESDEVLYSQEDNDDLSKNVDEDVLGASPPYNKYSVSVSDKTLDYGSSGSISMTVTTCTGYSYKYDFYLRIYDSNGVQKVNQRYYSSTGSSKVTKTYTIGSNQFSPGVYTIKIINYADSKQMALATLTIRPLAYTDYSVNVRDHSFNYGSSGSISMSITPASSSHYYKYDFYLRIYDSNNVQKVNKRYYSTSSASKVTYSVGSTQFNPGVYTIKIINYADNIEMASATLTIKPLAYSDYSVDVSDKSIYYDAGGSISMAITPASSGHYYRYDFYLKIYDSNGNEKVNQRYYSTSDSSKITKSYTIGSAKLNKGVYTIKIINTADNILMDSAKLTIKKISIASNNLNTKYKDTINYNVRVAENNKYKSGLKVTFICKGNKYQVTTDKNGYATLKIHLKAGKYDITTKCGGVTKKNTIKVNPLYVANKYKDVYVKPLNEFYNGNNKISYGFKGNLEGYFKIYKGKKLLSKTKLNSNGYIKDYFKYNRHDLHYGGSAIKNVGTYKAVITNAKGKVIAKAKVKIKKSPTFIYCDSFKSKIGARESIWAIIDSNYYSDNLGGIVKFKIGKQTYKAKVKDDLAIIKNIKFPIKAKTLKCKVKFSGNKYYKASSAKFKIKLSKSYVVILKKNHVVKVGKYSIKLSSKQYKSLVKAFKKNKSKKLKIITNYGYNVKKYYYKTVKKYKTTTSCYTVMYDYYLTMNKMKNNGWKKVSQYKYWKKNPRNKYGIGLSAYQFAVTKWVKTYKVLTYKVKTYPIKAKITTVKDYPLPDIVVYSHGKTFKHKLLAIA